jgi:hypothetical protein
VSGREHDALAFLLDGLRSGFDALPIDWTWITTVIGYAVVAIELEHKEAAAALQPIIEPYADQVAFTGGTSQGYIGAYVGKLASLLGDHDVADAHLRRALEVHRSTHKARRGSTTRGRSPRSEGSPSSRSRSSSSAERSEVTRGCNGPRRR